MVHVHYGASVLAVKGNQPTLYADLATYFSDPDTVIASFEQDCTVDRHRGRTEPRSIEVSCGMNDYLAPNWPLVGQVARLTRTVTVGKTGKATQEVVYLITDFTPIQASPRRLLDLERGNWSIENRLHYVRDVSFGEDRSRLHSGSSLIAASRRHFAAHPREAFTLFLQGRSAQQ